MIGSTRKYVGETARTMGSDPAYVAYPNDPTLSATVHPSYGAARDYLIWQVTHSVTIWTECHLNVR